MSNVSENINIDPTVLDNKNQSYSSLTDENKISIFSNEYQSKIKQYQKVQEVQNLQLQKNIFVVPLGNEDTQIKEMKSTLFLNANYQVIQKETVEVSNQSKYILPAVGVLIVIFVIFMFYYFKKRKESWKTNEIDNYDNDKWE